jgi:hypothetical protein|tara:strand:- start:84 stop:356 length:273 start_codon:yes stop_codon:yes gene_type:complete
MSEYPNTQISQHDLMRLISEIADNLTRKEFGNDCEVNTEHETYFTDEAQELFDQLYDEFEDIVLSTLGIEFDNKKFFWVKKEELREESPF